MSDKKLKRRLNAFFRLLIILSICVITVYLFPKVGSFQYEYQKGMPWRYETLTAPFDFPIHKTEDELQEEREKLVQEQSPIFILNTNTADLQTGKFRTALHAFRNETTSGSLNKLTDRLKDIYTAGILQLPEELDARKVKTIKIVENNIGHTVEFDQVYTLKKAYSALSQAIDQLHFPKSVRENILSLNLNNYLHPLPCFRVYKAQLLSVQALAVQRFNAVFRAVDSIPRQRVPCGCHMYPDLVGAPCL